MQLDHDPRERDPRLRRRVVTATIALALVAPALVTQAALPAAAADCSTVPWMDAAKTPEERAAALLAASTQHQKYRWLVEQPANTPQQTTWLGRRDLSGAGAVHADRRLHRRPGRRAVHRRASRRSPRRSPSASTWNQPLAVRQGRGPGRGGLRQAEERACSAPAGQWPHAAVRPHPRVLRRGPAAHRAPRRRRRPRPRGGQPRQAGPRDPQALRGERAGARPPDQLVERRTSARFGEIYDLPFEIAIDRGRPESVMCSYNQINGVYACENPSAERGAQRATSGFDGYVMSDFGSVHSTAPSLVNGLDQELNRPICFTPARLDAALAAGQITQAQIDAAASRVVRSYIRGGLFDHPLPATPVTDASTRRAQGDRPRELAEQGSVLLKNDGAAPAPAGIGQTRSPSSGRRRLARRRTASARARSAACRGASAPRSTLNCEDLVSPGDRHPGAGRRGTARR